MDGFQIAMLLVLLVFYAVYFGKMLLQRRQGVTTNQMGKGSKAGRTQAIERLLSAATMLIVPVEVISIALNTRLFPTAGIIFAALGVLAFTAAVLTMKDSWRAGIPDEDKTALVTTGIYRVSRNPAFRVRPDLHRHVDLLPQLDSLCVLCVRCCNDAPADSGGGKVSEAVVCPACEDCHQHTPRYFVFF